MSDPSAPAASGRVLSVGHSLRAVLGLCFIAVMIAVDQTVVGTALPTIVAELQGFQLYAWAATAYLLTCVITVPIFGRLGDYYGRKPFIIVSIIVFTLGSILCSLSGSMVQLVVARGVQGVGGGMLLGTAFASIPDLFPEPDVRLRWQILLSAAFGIANAVGPTLGGFLTQYAGWRSVFYVNVPVGLVSLFMIWRYLPWIRHFRDRRVHLDWQGAILIAVGFGSLQLFVELLPRDGASLPVIVLGLLAVLALMAFIWWEQRCPQPLVPLGMLRDRSLASLFILSLFLGCLLFVLLFYVPLMLQGGFSMTPREAGLAITPLVVCITVGSIINGRIVIHLPHSSYMLYAGFALMALCIFGLMFTSIRTAPGLLAFYMVLGGFGLGFVMPNLTVFAQQVAGRSQLGIVTAMLQSTRMMGGMFGTALVGSLVSHFYVQGIYKTIPGLAQASWRVALEDPQVLVNAEEQSSFIAQLFRLDLNGVAFIESARIALVDAVHVGLLATLLVAVIATAWVSRVPFINLRSPIAGDQTTGKPS